MYVVGEHVVGGPHPADRVEEPVGDPGHIGADRPPTPPVALEQPVGGGEHSRRSLVGQVGIGAGNGVIRTTVG